MRPAQSGEERHVDDDVEPAQMTENIPTGVQLARSIRDVVMEHAAEAEQLRTLPQVSFHQLPSVPLHP